jgi:hypothetical protein
MLSADMADILSNLYLAHSVKWYHKHHKISKKLTEYCVERLCQENQRSFNRIIENNKHLKPFLFFIKESEKPILYKSTKEIIDEIKNNHYVLDTLKKDIIIEGTPLEDLTNLSKLQSAFKTDYDYNKLYEKVIQVGEYDNSSIILPSNKKDDLTWIENSNQL